MTWLFGLTSFVTAALLFIVEPMVAKFILPTYGGTAAVWNISVVFFQLSLLLGYAYAHGTWRTLGRNQPVAHSALLLLPLLTIPFALPSWAAPGDGVHESIRLLAVLLVMIGAPFIALSTSGPLLQAWFSSTNHPRARDPYFLYAASNAGSFVGLLSYPLFVERTLALDDQSRVWSIAYGVAVALLIVCAFVARRRRTADVPKITETTAIAADDSVTWRQRFRWMLLAAIPSSLMLGVTTYVTTDIGAVPLLWVIPLSVYLLTFVVAFGRPTTTDQRSMSPGLLAATGLVVMASMMTTSRATVLLGIIHIAVFGFFALTLHRRLAADRPAALHLTQFYLFVALGGAVGSAFNSLIAPLIFREAVEYFIVLIVALFALHPTAAVNALRTPKRVALGGTLPLFGLIVLFRMYGFDITSQAMTVLIVVAVATFVCALLLPRLATGVIAVCATTMVASLIFTPDDTWRSFYGVYNVYREPDAVWLKHGETIHGTQRVDPAYSMEPTTYYARSGPLGDVMRSTHTATSRTATTVGMNWSSIGLGAGTMAAYNEPADQLTFYELDPLDVEIATNPRNFTYIRDALGKVDIIVGDGRLRIGDAVDSSNDLIVLDAFSSDSIPAHLLTTQAVDLYRSKLKSDGVLAFHVSNINIDLLPVMRGIAADQGLPMVQKSTRGIASQDKFATDSSWVVMSGNEAVLTDLRATGWLGVEPSATTTLTDTESNLLPLLKF
jgi:hypothetical protein